MKTVQQIVDWIEETSALALQRAREEANPSDNHAATAYVAEHEILEDLKEWIMGPCERPEEKE